MNDPKTSDLRNEAGEHIGTVTTESRDDGAIRQTVYDDYGNLVSRTDNFDGDVYDVSDRGWFGEEARTKR